MSRARLTGRFFDPSPEFCATFAKPAPLARRLQISSDKGADNMILEAGSKILVVHRRLFETDHSRFFLGIVDGYDQGVAKVRGNTWMRDPFTAEYFQKGDLRTKLVAVGSGTLLIYELPPETDLQAIRFAANKDGKLLLTDGKQLKVDLTETEHANPTRKGVR
jgi:hypothetical protein